MAFLNDRVDGACWGLKIAAALCKTLLFVAPLGVCVGQPTDATEYEATVKVIDPNDPTGTAPDGFKVWVLEDINAGGVAQFQLPKESVGGAIMHRTVSEIWFIQSGRGKVWIDGLGEREIYPGTYFIVPPQTGFQVRSDSTEELTVIGLTMPPFTPDEVIEIDGPWTATSDVETD